MTDRQRRPQAGLARGTGSSGDAAREPPITASARTTRRGCGAGHGCARPLNAWSMSRPSLSATIPLALLDDDAAIERVLALLVDDLGFERGAVLEDGDGGDIGQSLGGFDIGPAHFARLQVEQVEGSDDGAPQPHGQRVH